MAFPPSLQRARDRGVSTAFAATEMVAQYIAIQSPRSVEGIPRVARDSYLRLKVLEQNLQLYGRSPESGTRYQKCTTICIRAPHKQRPRTCREDGQLTLLLVSQQMGLALELLATLIAGRQALSLHVDGTIVVERRAALRQEVYLEGRRTGTCSALGPT